MTYGVPEGRLEEAMEMVDLYRDDERGLVLLREFYQRLPVARGACLLELRVMARQRGVLLLAAMTDDAGYIYLVADDGIEFLGRLNDASVDDGLLEYFGFTGIDEYRQKCRTPENFPPYTPVQLDVNVCPACHATTGEYHELGCPVEICPWCGGQLIHCNCRFDLLEEDFIAEEQLQRFEALLVEKGRLPYSPEQRPSYADEGGGVILD